MNKWQIPGEQKIKVRNMNICNRKTKWKCQRLILFYRNLFVKAIRRVYQVYVFSACESSVSICVFIFSNDVSILWLRTWKIFFLFLILDPFLQIDIVSREKTACISVLCRTTFTTLCTAVTLIYKHVNKKKMIIRRRGVLKKK